MNLVQFSFNEYGAYFIEQVEVQRGIKGKTRSKVNELLIVGVPAPRLHQWCIDNHIYITNKAVYNADTDEPLLFREGNSFTYKRKEEENGNQGK